MTKLLRGHHETLDRAGEIIRIYNNFKMKRRLRIVPENNCLNSFGIQWSIYRKTQLDSFTGLSISRKRLFRATGWPKMMKGEHILEAGSGAGRFTEILAETGAKICSFDHSLSAIRANLTNNGHYTNVKIFQADIYDIPLRRSCFDKVICLGVIQHTPDPEKAFESLARYVQPGGELIIDVYAKRLSAVLSWKYLLRPITKRIKKMLLLKILEKIVPLLIPATIFLRRIGRRIGAHLSPIPEYSCLGLSYEMNKEWVILDAFDMYASEYDHPQSIYSIKQWFKKAGFEDYTVCYGDNGITGKGYKPK